MAAKVKGSTRAVVLLSPEERKKLALLAASEHASFSEILRRCLRAYDPEDTSENDELLATMIAEMNLALDKNLESIRSARVEIRANLDEIARRRADAA